MIPPGPCRQPRKHLCPCLGPSPRRRLHAPLSCCILCDVFSLLERQSGREIFHSVVHSPDAHSSQGWTRPKPGARSSGQVSRVGAGTQARAPRRGSRAQRACEWQCCSRQALVRFVQLRTAQAGVMCCAPLERALPSWPTACSSRGGSAQPAQGLWLPRLGCALCH